MKNKRVAPLYYKIVSYRKIRPYCESLQSPPNECIEQLNGLSIEFFYKYHCLTSKDKGGWIDCKFAYRAQTDKQGMNKLYCCSRVPHIIGQ